MHVEGNFPFFIIQEQISDMTMKKFLMFRSVLRLFGSLCDNNLILKQKNKEFLLNRPTFFITFFYSIVKNANNKAKTFFIENSER